METTVNFIALALFVLGSSSAAGNVYLETEKYVLLNESAYLECVFSEPEEFVFKVEWHRVRTQVAEYVNRSTPEYHGYPLAGSVVDESVGTWNLTVLRYLDWDATGNYSCSVTTWPNETTTYSEKKEIIVVETLPEEHEDTIYPSIESRSGRIIRSALIQIILMQLMLLV